METVAKRCELFISNVVALEIIQNNVRLHINAMEIIKCTWEKWSMWW
jgi:hypothetical protein